MSEQWKPIVGWEGWYEVSDQGRVRSVERVITRVNRWGNPAPHVWQGRVLRGRALPRGYLRVHLGGRDRYIHALVAESFIGPRPAGMEVCHSDCDVSNNRATNLRYDTHINNSQDSTRLGRMNRGTRNGAARLTEHEVRAIRGSADLNRELAARFGVSSTTVSRIKHRALWKHVA